MHNGSQNLTVFINELGNEVEDVLSETLRNAICEFLGVSRVKQKPVQKSFLRIPQIVPCLIGTRQNN